MNSTAQLFLPFKPPSIAPMGGVICRQIERAEEGDVDCKFENGKLNKGTSCLAYGGEA